MDVISGRVEVADDDERVLGEGIDDLEEPLESWLAGELRIRGEVDHDQVNFAAFDPGLKELKSAHAIEGTTVEAIDFGGGDEEKFALERQDVVIGEIGIPRLGSAPSFAMLAS